VAEASRDRKPLKARHREGAAEGASITHFFHTRQTVRPELELDTAVKRHPINRHLKGEGDGKVSL